MKRTLATMMAALALIACGDDESPWSEPDNNQAEQADTPDGERGYTPPAGQAWTMCAEAHWRVMDTCPELVNAAGANALYTDTLKRWSGATQCSDSEAAEARCYVWRASSYCDHERAYQAGEVGGGASWLACIEAL